MPQIIVGFIAIVAACYALIYALAILIYALLLGVPTVAVVAFVGWISATLLLKWTARVTRYEFQHGPAGSMLIRHSTFGHVGWTVAIAMTIAVVVGALVLTLFGQQVLDSGGTDAIWVRITGMVWAAILAIAFVIWYFERLRNLFSATKTEPLTSLIGPLSEYSQMIETLNHSATTLAIEIHPEWEDLLDLATQTKHDLAVDVIASVLLSKTDRLRAMNMALPEIAELIREIEVSVRTAMESATGDHIELQRDQISVIAEIIQWRTVKARLDVYGYEDYLLDLKRAVYRLTEITSR